jgi:ABC-type Na+ efflux pump permease subunit
MNRKLLLWILWIILFFLILIFGYIVFLLDIFGDEKPAENNIIGDENETNSSFSPPIDEKRQSNDGSVKVRGEVDVLPSQENKDVKFDNLILGRAIAESLEKPEKLIGFLAFVVCIVIIGIIFSRKILRKING